MTRKDSVRAATGTTKDSVRHAAEVVAPYAETAKDSAVHYAHEAGARLGPKAARAAHQARTSARDGYDQYVVPRIAQARQNMPEEWEVAADRAAERARRAARQANAYAAPRIESAVTAASPVRDEATARGAAALAALRGQVTTREIEKLTRRRTRRARTGRFTGRLVLLGLVAGGAYAAWRWWDKQANPDWLVEPPPATEVGGRGPVTPVNGADAASSSASSDTGAAAADEGLPVEERNRSEGA